MNEELAAELERMAAEDQRVRTSRVDARRGRPSFDEMMAMSRVDVANTDRLREIVDEHGWPGRSLVGEEGAQNAWLLAQHAGHDLQLQRRVLALLEEAVAAGEATPRQLAYLADRVRMHEGRPQLYGTQMFGGGDGELVPWPIEDEERLDERRAAAGLEPFVDYAARWRGRGATAPAPSPRPSG